MNIKDVLLKEIKSMKSIKVSVIADAFEIQNIYMKVSSILFWEDRMSIDSENVALNILYKNIKDMRVGNETIEINTFNGTKLIIFR